MHCIHAQSAQSAHDEVADDDDDVHRPNLMEYEYESDHEGLDRYIWRQQRLLKIEKIIIIIMISDARVAICEGH